MKFMCQQHKDTIVIHESLICPFCSALTEIKESEAAFDALENHLTEIIDKEKQSVHDAKDNPTGSVNNDEITEPSNS